MSYSILNIFTSNELRNIYFQKSGSVSYLINDPTDASDPGAVFTGDTLFIAGCGRFFEGTPDQMHYSLNTVLASLNDDTHVYCGHEYTIANLKFALSVEPENTYIREKLDWAVKVREKQGATVPSTIGGEKRWNPFMRVSKADVIKAAVGVSDRVESDIEVMRALREMKNNFRG